MVATSGKGWRLAPSLVALVAEIDARWPGRSTASDGSIGDQAHAARSSEHNPDHDPDPMPTGYVSAVDVTKASPQMAAELLRKLIADPRTWYVIHAGFIYSRSHGFGKRRYTGENPHKAHLHVSLVQTAKAANDASSWGIAPIVKPVEAEGRKPGERELHEGNTGRDVAALQEALEVTADGVFGPKTTAAVKRYQRLHRIAQDGIVGPRTWGLLLRKATTS